jgi:hypothetical protein
VRKGETSRCDDEGVMEVVEPAGSVAAAFAGKAALEEAAEDIP